MGRYYDTDRRGGWMAARLPDWEQAPHVCVLVRGRAALPPGRHMLRLSAGGYYYAWLDGKWLGQGPAPAGEGCRYFQEYPVEGGRTVTVALKVRPSLPTSKISTLGQATESSFSCSTAWA